MVVGPGGHDGNGEVASTRGATGWELALVTNPSSNGSAVNNNKLVSHSLGFSLHLISFRADLHVCSF